MVMDDGTGFEILVSLPMDEFLSWYALEIERTGDQSDIDRWNRLVKDFPSAVEAWGEEKALVWLAGAFLGPSRIKELRLNC